MPKDTITDSTVARIAGNLLSGVLKSKLREIGIADLSNEQHAIVRGTVKIARAIVAETLRQSKEQP